MSLFDALRYPISNPPTKEEFELLPADLLFNWLQMTDWKEYIPNGTNINSLVDFYSRKNPLAYERDDILVLKELSLLRQMIKEYDDI